MHVEEGCKARICFMEDSSLAEGNKIPIIYGDNPQYGEIKFQEEEKYRLRAEEKEKAEERAHKDRLKKFDAFAKKVKNTQELGVYKDTRHVCHLPGYGFQDILTAERNYPKTLIISHLTKKTTICSGDKNYSMTIYVTPQAFTKIEKDTGTGTVITVSDEVAAALVGDK